MAEGRNCCVYLPNDKKLELFLQPKMLGKELMDVVAAHFKLKEKEYFGLFYESRNGQQWWLQDDKRILEHDIVKKSTSRLDLQFAVKYYVDSIKLLQHSITVELFFLQIRSLIYKGRLDIDAEVVFKLAAHVLQITYGDYVNDEITSGHLQKLPVLPSKVLQAHSSEHCENVITELYKELKGNTKGDSILNYLTCVETLPNYGIHYYQIKDKSGVPWWLGLGLKGIFQFDFHDKNTPFKAFYWRQLENLYFREKKFSIEVSGSLQRRSSGGAKSLLSTEPKKKSSEEVKVHAWYGSPALIKTIWIMSIAQHHFYLDQRQNNNKLKRSSSPLSDLSKELDENSNSLLVSKTDTPTMTQKHIRNVDITVKKGSKDETPEVRAAKREMSKALKSRRTELEDRLFDKVQELKKLCLQESEIIGKLPPEYIRYMDLNEVAPKIKKRVGAEFKVKLRNHKNVTSMDRDYPTSVTAASSSSSGISCETIDPADELSQLEQEFEILTQIANAAKKLATDPHAKGRTKNKRWRSFTKTIEKLQAVEEKINVFREKVGQKPSVRASMLIADDEDMIFDDGGISVGGESERSSLSDGLLLDDDTSLSSGGDAISTRSTPAIINGVPQYPASAMISRRNISSSADVDISDIQPKRSLTPPPSFNNFKMDSSSGTLKNNNHHNQYPLLPPSLSSSGVSVDSNKMPTNQNTTRNWIYQKWEVPRNRPNKGWHESSLDSLDTASSMSRQSEENRPTEQYESDSPTKSISNSAENLNIKVTRPLGSPAVAQKVDLKTKKAPMERPASANSNHNNHNEVLSATENDEDVFTLSKLKREVSDSALSELSVKSNPAAVPSTPSDVAKKNLPKIEESPVVETFRKRSSSFTESPSQPLHVPHRGPHKSKNGTLKSAHQPQFVPHPHHDTYNVQQGSISRAPHQGMENPGSINKSRSSQELQPTLYDTNLNIRMHYQNRNAVHHSYAAPTTASWTPPVELTNKSPQMGAMETDSRPDPGAFHPSFHPVYYHPFAPSVPQRFRGVPPNYYPTHHPMYPQRYVDSYSPLIMSSSQRDMLNNEVYQDIGMGWVPSLHEYSSRASVCESASAQSKKEDIKRVLEDHIAMKRTPSNSSSIQSNNNKVQRKIREQYRTLQQQQDNSQSNQSRSSHEKTWADYQKQAPYIAPRPSPQSSNNSSTVSRSQHKSSNDARTNLFHHKPPPPTSTSDAPPLLYKTQLQPRNQPQKSALSSASLQQTQAYYNPPQRIRQHANPTNSASRHDDGELKQRILLQHYLHHNHASVSRDHMNTNSSTHEHEPYQKVVQRFANDQRYYPVSIAPPDGQVFRVPTNRWVSQPNNASVTERIPVKDNGKAPEGGGKDLLKPEKSDANTVVIQALTKSPEGHEVSVFTVAKSAPNTPLPKRQSKTAFFAESSSDNEEDFNGPSKGTIKRQPETGSAKLDPSNMFSAAMESLRVDNSETSKQTSTPTIIVHTPSFKSGSQHSLVNHGEIGFKRDRGSDGRIERQVSEFSSKASSSQQSRQGRSPKKASQAPLPPPRPKREKSRNRQKDPGFGTASSKVGSDEANERNFIHSSSPAVSKSEREYYPSPASVVESSSTLTPSSSYPQYHPKPSPSPVTVHSGTLPRASKARRNLNKSGGAPSRSDSPITTFGISPDDAARNRKYRRNSLLGFDSRNIPVPSTPTLAPRYPLQNRRGNTLSPNLPSYSRSKSDVWKGGKQVSRAPLQGIPYDDTGGGHFYGIEGYSNPNAVRCRVDQHRSRYEGHHPLHRGQLSASAEDLLWSEGGDNQAGTLV